MAEQKIKRYFFRADRGDIVASDHGEWVRYEDVAHLIERPKADELINYAPQGCEPIMVPKSKLPSPSDQGPDTGDQFWETLARERGDKLLSLTIEVGQLKDELAAIERREAELIAELKALRTGPATSQT